MKPSPHKATLLVVLLLIGCPIGLGLQIQKPPPPPPEPPVPSPFEGEDAPPTLEATPASGLFRAAAVDPYLYYYAPDDLWYRSWRGKWYQAFRWNGAWFPPRRIPEALHSVPTSGQPESAAPRSTSPPP